MSATCLCVAYVGKNGRPFPHRAGSGRCTDPGPEPSCGECPHGQRINDPFSTGDHWHSEIECMAPQQICPWGKP